MELLKIGINLNNQQILQMNHDKITNYDKYEYKY